MSKHRLTITLVLAAIMLTVIAGFGDVPSTISYQGSLSDSEGQPITGVVTINFSIYDDALQGLPLWSETHQGVNVESGLFSALLGGAGSPLPDSAFASTECWLEITVDGEIITPRTRLNSMPYTFAAKAVKGDLETEPGKLTLTDAAKSGAYAEIMAETGASMFTQRSSLDANSPAVYTGADSEVGSFLRMYLGEPNATAICSWLELSLDPDANTGISIHTPDLPHQDLICMRSEMAGQDLSLSMGDPSDAGQGKVFEVKSDATSQTTSLAMFLSDPQSDINQRVLDLTARPADGPSAYIRMYDPQPEPPDTVAAMELSKDALIFENDLGGKSSLRTNYSKNGMAIGDPAAETLFVANQNGVFMRADSGKATYESYLTPYGLKLSYGAYDGYVLRCSGDGYASWCPADSIGEPPVFSSPGVAQAIDDSGDDFICDGTSTSFISQYINCPAPGYVLVIGSCDATVRRASSTCDCTFRFGVSDELDALDPDQRKEWRYTDDDFLGGGDYYAAVISAQKIFEVTSSGPKTFYMVGSRPGTGGTCVDTCWVDNKTLSLIYIQDHFGTVELGARSEDSGDEPQLATIDIKPKDERRGPEKLDRISQLEAKVEELTSMLNQLIETKERTEESENR